MTFVLGDKISQVLERREKRILAAVLAGISILTIFDVKDIDYIALIPLNEDGEGNEDGEVLIYRYAEDGEGNPSLSNIENDEEYEIVAERFDELLDEEEFGDDEEEI